ncbi:CYTH domain-containing protein [bacterium]|nr:CYTH domain-containing protein [bacterium]
MPHLNIELKARCDDLERLHRLLLEENAEQRGTDNQRDTYFKVPNGRLKLREGTIERSLIQYDRPDQAGPKASQVSLYHPGPDNPDDPRTTSAVLRATLLRALGELVTVEKRRRIYFIDNVKFHLDEVPGLGSFVEIEAIDADGSIGEARLREQCERYMHLFDIKADDLIERSYSDMLLGLRGGR